MTVAGNLRCYAGYDFHLAGTLTRLCIKPQEEATDT
jgi:hypothetical protein